MLCLCVDVFSEWFEVFSTAKVDVTSSLINALQQVGEYFGIVLKPEILIGRPMNTRLEPVKRQFLNVEHCENDVLHCCAARFFFLLTFIHRLN